MTVWSTHTSKDDAIAEAIRTSAPGDTIVICADDCPLVAIANPTGEQLATCGCKQLVIRIGAEASLRVSSRAACARL